MAEAITATDRTIHAPRLLRLLRIGMEAALVLMVAFVLVALVLGRVVPMTGRQTIIIGGSSMTPAIPMGSVAIVEPVPAGAVGVGDVVSIRAGNGAVVTHRVVRVADRDGGAWFEIKGDANTEPDPVLVDSATMLGRVTATIPYAGYLLRFLSIPAAVVAVLGLGATLIVALYLLDDAAAPRRRPAPARPSRSRIVLPDGFVVAPTVAYRKRRPRAHDRTGTTALEHTHGHGRAADTRAGATAHEGHPHGRGSRRTHRRQRPQHEIDRT